MRLRTALFSLLFAPILGLAQAPVVRADAAPQRVAGVDPIASKTGAVSMPLWSTSDGRILALIAFAGGHYGAPAMPQAPQIGSAADWQLVDVTHFVGGGLLMQLGSRVNAYAKFGHGILLEPLNPAAYSFGCNYGLAAANLCAWQPSRAVTSGDLRLGTDFVDGPMTLGVNYGVSWLHRPDEGTNALDAIEPWNLFATVGSETLPTLALPAMQLASLRDVGIGAHGQWAWDDAQSLNLGAALSRIQLDLPGNSLAPIINQAALSFGVHSGNFSGIIIGRMLGSADPLASGPNWTSIDLGLSWRAPWRGVFSIGAQNLWSSGNPPLLSAPAHEADPGQSRVPYVQYHQDL